MLLNLVEATKVLKWKVKTRKLGRLCRPTPSPHSFYFLQYRFASREVSNQVGIYCPIEASSGVYVRFLSFSLWFRRKRGLCRLRKHTFQRCLALQRRKRRKISEWWAKKWKSFAQIILCLACWCGEWAIR